MTAEKEKPSNVLKAFIKLLPIVYNASPKLFILSRIVGILHGLSWGVITYGQQQFFDSATSFAKHEIEFQSVIYSLLVMVLINIINQLLNGFGNFLPIVLVNKTQGVLTNQIHEKMKRLDPIVFEEPSILDDINKAENGKSNAIQLVMTVFIVLCFYLPYFFFMAWYLFTLKPNLVISIIFVFVPTFLTQLVRTNVFTKLEDGSAPLRRESDYYENCIVGREFFKETRLLGGFFFFQKLFKESVSLLNEISLKANIKTNLLELGMKFLTVCGYVGILIMLFDAFMKGDISVGQFAAVFSSVALLFSIMEEVMSRHFGSIAQNLGTIRNYINFLNIEERSGDKDINQLNEIELSNVSFSYPNADIKSINSLSLKIRKGETIAVVGENGSGKSTLVKLLLGLYLPSEGEVKYDGVRTSEANYESLYANSSAVFQKYQRYQMSLIDNITISSTGKKQDMAEIDAICVMAGVRADNPSFPNGYDTMLSREFDGVDLSGGQWQRIAIERGMFRNHELIVLDEPTAAIDPYEETRLLNLFAEMSKDTTTIIVTHRLGATKLADRILVMKKGELVEFGTHSELLNLNGEYKRMYECQQQWYVEA